MRRAAPMLLALFAAVGLDAWFGPGVLGILDYATVGLLAAILMAEMSPRARHAQP